MRTYLIIALLITSRVYGQQLRVSPEGESLKSTYLAMNVENLWLTGTHVDWQTGIADEPGARSGIRTHCSAFVAATCQKLGIYILRPPQHGQVLLANAQANWLDSPNAKNLGWTKMPVNDSSDYVKIQQLANQGGIVVVVSRNPDPHKPGHAALMMPADCSATLVTTEGPELIMAGTHNYNKITLIKGFRNHIKTWPSKEIDFFVHDVIKVL